MKHKAIGIIPARYGSTRFPGKMLASLCGKSVIEHVWQNAKASKLEQIIIATDDERIMQVCRGFGAKCVMTPPECPSGTDRIALVCKDIETDFVVNIQGDEPFITAEAINKALQALESDPDAVVGTLVHQCTEAETINSPDKVKAVFDANFNALYFSRSPIPHIRFDNNPEDFVHYIHIGLYAYRKDFLFTYLQTPPSTLEKAEKLEQLRVLEHGYKIKTAVIDYHGIGIDTPNDLQKATEVLCLQNSSS